jgi:hypothetical protein
MGGATARPRKCARVSLAALAALAVSSHGCDGGTPANKEPLKPAPPAWLAHVEVRVDRTQPAFDQNTEVFVTIVNRGAERVVIDGLAAPGAVSLQHEGGAARIHEISVGVKKPIEIEPGTLTSMSLLFEPAPGAPRTLRLYDRELPVPP